MNAPNSYPIPKNYVFIKILGEGVHGTVIKCVKCGTNEEVAMKISKKLLDLSLRQEAFIMRTLMKHNLDHFNIIKYNGELSVGSKLILEYESLDISLLEYLEGLPHKMPLEDIRTVIQQLAVALDALMRVNVIHTDLKLDNILLVDHVKKPLRVKIIDFGLALLIEKAKQGMILQPLVFRAPEIILDLPFSESIDIWSLGNIMANMMTYLLLFPGKDEYEILRYITELLGPPPGHLLKAGRSDKFFIRTDDGSWRLKTCMEYYGSEKDLQDRRSYTFRSLDESNMNRHYHSFKTTTEAAEWRECIELLKAMLQWDEKDRITPSGILNHPFITKSYLKSKCFTKPCNTHSIPTTKQKKMNKIKKMDELKDKDIEKNDEKNGDEKKKENCFRCFWSWNKRKFTDVVESVSRGFFRVKHLNLCSQV